MNEFLYSGSDDWCLKTSVPTRRGMYSFLDTGDKFTSMDKGRKRFCLKSHKCHTTYRGPEDHLTDQSEAVQRQGDPMAESLTEEACSEERPGERTCDPEVLSTTRHGVGPTTPSTTTTRERQQCRQTAARLRQTDASASGVQTRLCSWAELGGACNLSSRPGREPRKRGVPTTGWSAKSPMTSNF